MPGVPHSGHRSGVARKSYPHAAQTPAPRRRLRFTQPTTRHPGNTAKTSSGSYDAVERMTGDRLIVAGGRIDLWPFAAALGCLGYLAAILARRVDP